MHCIIAPCNTIYEKMQSIIFEKTGPPDLNARKEEKCRSKVIKTREMKSEISRVKKINGEHKSRGKRITRTTRDKRKTKYDWQ